jgi:hypothetical protein
MNFVRRAIVACALLPAAGSAFADITSVALGDKTGEDWEPAILADGGHVYALWPHWMDNRATPGGNFTCLNSGATGMCGVWNVYTRSSADGATNWSTETRMSVPTPYRTYQSSAGFDHPYGDYTETVTDGIGNFYGIWAEGESLIGTGDVYAAKY